MAFDVPLAVLYRRIDMIRMRYGRRTSVQITGGDPTLRSVEDLQAICGYIRKLGLRSCLMTNGIRAKRTLLRLLDSAGLDDVAFHVDLTQVRAGYPDENSLNAVRREYIRRCDGLGLRVLFNTTIFGGNVAELPDLARFFRSEAANVRLASFNIQADTGRGVMGTRTNVLNLESVAEGLEAGVGTKIDFDVAEIGHASCTRYGALLVAGDSATSALANSVLFEDILEKIERHRVVFDATTAIRPSMWRVFARIPLLALRSAAFLLGRLWRLRGGLAKSRGRVHSLTLLIHNFMDANQLDNDRCASCVFMVATENGPISMCAHNARRDEHIFAPAKVGSAGKPRWWHPSTGRITASGDLITPESIPLKRLKGRLRQQAMEERAGKAGRS